MKHFSRLVLFLCLFVSHLVLAQSTPTPTAPQNPAPVQPTLTNKVVQASLIYSNAIEQNLPQVIFEGGTFQTEANAQFTKLHLYFDEAISVTDFKVSLCQAVQDELTYYINFDSHSGFVSSGGTGSFAVSSDFKNVRSITFNFNQTKGVCIKSVEIQDKNAGVNYQIQPSKALAGTVTASSTLSPTLSYDALNLFDSRFEYAWSSKGKSVGENLQFNFATPVTITKLKIWNGYQRSPVHCVSNSRPKTVALSGDNGYQATISIKDSLEPQVIDLPTAFQGQNLKMTFTEAYPGNKYADLVISELRFHDGQNWFGLNPLPLFQKTSQENRTQFAKAGLAHILNTSLDGPESAKKQYGNWTFRLRADGSIYIQGYADGKNGSTDFYGLGNFEIKEATDKHIKLRVFGLLRRIKFPYGGDCNGCGQDCNKLGLSQAASDVALELQDEKIFQDFIYISKTPEFILVENREAAKQLKFSRVEVILF